MSNPSYTGHTSSNSSHFDHEPDHREGTGLRSWLAHLFSAHSHSRLEGVRDPGLATRRGIQALKVSLGVLLAMALFQLAIVAASGSVALLADTLHNFSDALTAIPLWLAFRLAQRARNHRYTYGYGRAEDLAGGFVVLIVAINAGLVFYESFQKIIDPRPMTNLGWVAAAAVIGFLGNELVALYRLRIGREIGSAALVADGLHARTDGLTSLGVLAGVIGVWLGYPLADPIAGFAIGAAILAIAVGAAREMWFRVMDATDPALTERIEALARSVQGVLDVHNVALRWVGHRQRGELHITVDCQLPTYESNRVAEEVRRQVFTDIPALDEMTIQVDPCECEQASGCRLAELNPS